MARLEIYQANPSNWKTMFVSKEGPNVLINLKEQNYRKVYVSESWEIDGDINFELENIFHIFNVDFPEDFIGRSLSVGDIVRLDDQYFYCEAIGWKEIGIIENTP